MAKVYSIKAYNDDGRFGQYRLTYHLLPAVFYMSIYKTKFAYVEIKINDAWWTRK